MEICLTPDQILDMEAMAEREAVLEKHFKSKIAHSLSRKKSFKVKERKKKIATTYERSSLTVSKSGAIHSRVGSTYNLRMPPKRWSSADAKQAYQEFLDEEYADMLAIEESYDEEYCNEFDKYYEEYEMSQQQDDYDDYPYPYDYWGVEDYMFDEDMYDEDEDEDEEDIIQTVYNIFANVKTVNKDFKFLVASLSYPMEKTNIQYYFNWVIERWLVNNLGELPETYQISYECKSCQLDHIYGQISLTQI